jgi:hypothetical protein
MVSQKYQHYCNGPYALVDSYYRGIWLTLHDENLAHSIRKVFVSKIPFLVFDLTSFANFDSNQNTVDSTVCFEWQIPATNNHYSISPNLYDKLFERTLTQKDYTNQTNLINLPDNSPISEPLRQDLQNQLFFYKELTQCFQAHALRQQQQGSKYQKDQQPFVDRVREIFQVELTTQDIEQQLQKMARECLENHGQYSVILLNMLGANLYE